LHWYLLSVDKKDIYLQFGIGVFDCIWLEGHSTLFWVEKKLVKCMVNSFIGKNVPDKFTTLTSLVYCMRKLKYNYMPSNYNQWDHCTLEP